ncbi:MAG: leucine-rich repeat protein [Bacilli bacterium]|nr:leucine-rich repeat protein [Bacilli bacterium]
MLSYDLKMIKDKYGEKMMHLCRRLFPSLLDHEGLLFKLLSEHFEFNKELCDDIIEGTSWFYSAEEEFKNFIYALVDVESIDKEKKEESPEELLDKAGYILIECHSEEDIQSFRKYYAPREELCTFHGGRLNSCFVFFAVKKNVDEIRRENFLTPKREDEYGTSVISIQFSRGDINTLSIKNRYNHTVNNPDATFGNNLDNIIPGLTDAFTKKYDFNINYNTHNFSLPGYVKANDGKFYKYNYEINNVYYCTNNVIIDNFEVKRLDKAKYIIADYYIIDKVNKTISLHDDKIKDSFINTIGKIDKIEETVDKATNNRSIIINNSIIITLDRGNRIINFVNNKLEDIPDNFMHYNKTLKTISIPNVRLIGHRFLPRNIELKDFKSPLLIKVGDFFLSSNEDIEAVDIPNVESVGHNFMGASNKIKVIKMPKLKEAGDYFMFNNKVIESIDFPLLEKVGDYFLQVAPLYQINIPNITEVGALFLSNCKVKELTLEKLKTIGNSFLSYNRMLQSLSLPNVETIGNEFLVFCQNVSSLNLPKVKTIGHHFLGANTSLRTLYLPEVVEFDLDRSFNYQSNPYKTRIVLTIYAPKLEEDAFKDKESETLIVVKGEPLDEESKVSKNRGL